MFEGVLLPLSYLRGMHLIARGDLVDRELAADRLEGNPGLEIGGVALSFAAHAMSSRWRQKLPYSTVQFLGYIILYCSSNGAHAELTCLTL